MPVLSGKTPIKPNHAFDPDEEGESSYAVRSDDPRVNRLVNSAGPPANPTNVIYELSTPGATGGTFTLSLTVATGVDLFTVLVTEPINWDAQVNEVRDALGDAITTLGYDFGDLNVTGDPLQPGDETVTIEFVNRLGSRAIPIDADNVDLVDGSVEAVQVQDGQTGTTDYPQGALIVDLDSEGALWVNLGGTGLGGDNAAPNWQLVPLTLTVRNAAEVPAGAPTGTELPVAFDSTAVTGGLYIWTGAAWVQVSVIP